MKKLVEISILIIFLITPSIALSETLKIITKENAIRKENRFLSKIILYIKYGDEVEGLGREGDWYKVRFKGEEGWVHKSAVEVRKVDLSGILGGKRTRHEEVALAGKGFNPDVERAYRNKHPEAMYHIVDRIESLKVKDEEIESFIKKGNLKSIK